EDRLLHCLPLHHLHGLVVGLLGSLFAGASVRMLERFDAARVRDELARDGTTLFYGVPSTYAQLLALDAAPALPGMRLFVSGSGPRPPALKRRFAERFGHVILERYGATETGILLSQPCAGERPAGSVGVPLAGVETRLVPLDADDIPGASSHAPAE